jgi:hypothetical protein
MEGDAIRLTFQPVLSSYRGKLLSDSFRGYAVHAAAFLRQRRIVLESALTTRRRDLSRILVHELFHFAWMRLGNPLRLGWEEILAEEWKRNARGELGWSAESRKQRLRPLDPSAHSSRWREYACESFCDTAAWLYSTSGPHPEYTLALRYRELRRRWMRTSLGMGPIAV